MKPSHRVAAKSSFVLVLVGIVVAGCDEADGRDPMIEGIPTATAEPDLRIDGYEADLVPVTWLGVGRDGTIALVQWQDHTVRFFDVAGEDLGSVGRRGEGPGEFERPIRAGWVGDTLWVSDTQLARLTFMSPEREVVRTSSGVRDLRPMPSEEDRFPQLTSATPYAVYPGDTLLVAARMASGDSRAAGFEGQPLLRVSPDGVIHRLVLERPDLESLGMTIPFADGSAAYARIPFAHRPAWRVSPNGDRVATLSTVLDGPDVGAFHVTVVDGEGEEVFSRVYPLQETPIPASAADSAVAAAAEEADHPDVRSTILSDMSDLIPSVYSPIRDVDSLVLGSDGRTWVGLRPTGESGSWLVLSAEGDLEARMVLPANVALKAADATHVWAVERDPFDVESVVRFRVNMPDQRSPDV